MTQISQIKFLVTLVLTIILTPYSLIAATDDSSDAARDTIAQINHINWVVSKIKTYNNAIVLEDEYKQISPDKLNLNRIPDKSTLEKIISMLDLLHGMINEERELKEWKRGFEIRRKRKQFEFWRGQCGVVQSTASGLDWTGVIPGAGAVLSISRSALSSYRDYENFLEDFEDEAMKKKFAMETSKINRLHDLNKDLLQSQWKMIQDYNFDDSLRVSDSDISVFITALKDSDHSRVYSRIEAMRDKFKIFPLFWYYLSSVALETGHPKEAMDACDKYFEVNRGLFRDDPIVGAVAMNKLYLLQKTNENMSEARQLLELVWKHNAGEVDWRKDYFCASIYASYLKDTDSAIKVLTHAMSALESSVSDQLHDLEKNTNALSESIDFADGESLWMCKKQMAAILANRAIYNEQGLKELCNKETTSNIEKLDYVGKMTVPRLWDVIGKEVQDITIEVKNKLSWKGINNEIRVTVPIRWLLSGELSVRLELLKNDTCTSSHVETRQKRAMANDRKVVMCFDVSRKELVGVDAVRVAFLHPDYPTALTFASSHPYQSNDKASAPGLVVNDANFNAGKELEDLWLMVASFKGVEYYRSEKNGNFIREVCNWERLFKDAFPHIQKFAAGPIDVKTNGVDRVTVCGDGSISIKYRNTTTEKIRPSVSVYLLSRYGVVLKRIDDSWKIRSLKPNVEVESKKYDGVSSAAFIDIETAE